MFISWCEKIARKCSSTSLGNEVIWEQFSHQLNFNAPVIGLESTEDAIESFKAETPKITKLGLYDSLQHALRLHFKAYLYDFLAD